MANTLLHRVEVLASETVETVRQLQGALGALQGPGRDDRHLSDTLVVELVAETLSDGSVAYALSLRKAEPA
jgi:hypothetical protein